MKSQVRGPTCAAQFKSYIDQFEDKEGISIQVLRGGFQRWKSMYGSDEELTFSKV